MLKTLQKLYDKMVVSSLILTSKMAKSSVDRLEKEKITTAAANLTKDQVGILLLKDQLKKEQNVIGMTEMNNDYLEQIRNKQLRLTSELQNREMVGEIKRSYGNGDIEIVESDMSDDLLLETVFIKGLGLPSIDLDGSIDKALKLAIDENPKLFKDLDKEHIRSLMKKRLESTKIDSSKESVVNKALENAYQEGNEQ